MTEPATDEQIAALRAQAHNSLIGEAIRWTPALLARIKAEQRLRSEAEVTVLVLREALERIERWFGEFPETGHFWPNQDGTPSDRPMQYSAVFGSHGERDYMRGIARAALTSTAATIEARIRAEERERCAKGAGMNLIAKKGPRKCSTCIWFEDKHEEYRKRGWDGLCRFKVPATVASNFDGWGSWHQKGPTAVKESDWCSCHATEQSP